MIMVLVIPSISFAQDLDWKNGLVKCGTGAVDKTTGKISDECDFNALMDLINRLINFILVGLAVPIAAIMFAYAGFTMLAVGGESAGGMEKAKSVFSNTVLGLVAIACAWIVIHTILSVLGYEGSWIGF